MLPAGLVERGQNTNVLRRRRKAAAETVMNIYDAFDCKLLAREQHSLPLTPSKKPPDAYETAPRCSHGRAKHVICEIFK